MVMAAASSTTLSKDANGRLDTRSANGYVDSAVCARCHQEIARTYKLTGMGRSAYRPTVENKIEDYELRNTVEHELSKRTYRMLSRNGAFYQLRWQIGYDGKQTNTLKEPVDLVIGSGNHARTYLRKTPAGEWKELPISWYSEQGGYWAMSPGYDRPDQEDFRRVVPEECLFCHNAYPVPGSQRVAEGIDCQRCHGPGGKHIAAVGSGHAKEDAIRQSILNPARLSRERQLEVCYQCHLETTSSPLPYQLRRYEKEVFSYQPGERLADFALYFDRDRVTDDRFEIAHAAYRLSKSKCFLKSQMTCTTCHNPHDVPKGQMAVSHYVSVCKTCHQRVHLAEKSQGNCLDCHMPKRRAEDAVHVVMTDHLIRRDQPDRDWLAARVEADTMRSKYRGEVIPYYPTKSELTAMDSLYLAVAQVRDKSNLETGIEQLKRELQSTAAANAEASFELGKAYFGAGDKQQATVWLQKALSQNPGLRPAAKELAAVLYANNQPAKAVVLLEGFSRNADARLLTDLANGYLQMGRVEQADIVLHRSLIKDPELPETHNLLGLVRLRKGDKVRAEQSFREAIRQEPRMAEAHGNLGILIAERGDAAQARYHFQQAIDAEPNYAEGHYRFALLLELDRAYERAESEFRRAIEIKPSFAMAHNDLGDLLAAQSRTREAKEEYRLAIAGDPQLGEARYSMALLLVGEEKWSEAEDQLTAALKTNPNYFEAHLLLANVLEATNRGTNAKIHYRRAAESPDANVRDEALGKLNRK